MDEMTEKQEEATRIIEAIGATTCCYRAVINLKTQALNIVMPRFKIHYAPSGEWGSIRVNCGKYYTTDVAHTGNKDKVTCKYCLRLLNGA